MPQPSEVLQGITVGVTAERRAGDQEVMFRRLGAQVVLGPAISTSMTADSPEVRDMTFEALGEPPDFLIADTGIGLRAWFEAARGWGVLEQLVSALGSSRIAARGPKAAGALSSYGLKSWWKSPTERLDDLVDHLVAQDVSDARILFQLHGEDSEQVVERLRGAGATVVTLQVYRWGPPVDARPAQSLVERCVEGSIDALTFTARPQVGGLLQIADRVASASTLVEALHDHGVVVGCIGPVCAEAAVACGFPTPVVPSAWRLGSMVKTVTEALAGRRG